MTALHKAGAGAGALLLALAGGCQILLGVTGEDVPLPSDGGVGDCEDGAKGSDETDVDCGGKCSPCEDGKYLGGDFNGSIDFGEGKLTSEGGTDLFLAKFDGMGKLLWNKRFGDANAQVGAGVAVDAEGSIYLLSTCMGVVDFGGGPLTSAGGATSGADVFIAKFDATGKHVWSARYGDSHDQAGAGLAAQKGAAILGTFGGTLDFGTTSLMASGATDVFVARLQPPP